MKKRRIVFASVLNPVDDTRMFEKMGVSLAGQDGYEIFIIGQPVNNIPVHAGIHFLPCKKVKRVSISRLLLPLQIALKLIKVKPDLLVVNTHELLIVSITNRIIFGCKIVYDLRENYYRNIRFAEGFPFWLRSPLALCVRLKEKITAPLFHHFILAEKTYQNEVTFIDNRYTVLENKAALSTTLIHVKNTNSSRLLFSGTIAPSTGVIEAIALSISLHDLQPEISLTIVGYCALESMKAKIRDLVKDKPFIRLIGFDHPVPHQHIMDEIRKADFGIVYYPSSPHTSGSVPTKLYEYLAYQLPILTWQNQTFRELVLQHQAGLVVTEPYALLLDNMGKAKFYPKPPENVFWEADKFRERIEKLLS